MSRLELRGIAHRYPGAGSDTLHAVDLAVPDGRMLAVVGPSGSGKSTLLRVAAGLARPSAGEVRLDGRDVTTLPTERRDLTVMFQRPHLFDHLDVAGNAAFSPRLAGRSRREARAVAARYLRLVRLEKLAGRSVGELSGGQQQRVALARALAAERGVMLLDEPFTSLDRELRASMHDLLGEVRAALSPTVVLVTHDLDEAALADEAAVLVGGRVEQVAPVADLYRRPASLVVSRLVGGFTEVPGEVVGGSHCSPWGRVALPGAGWDDGPAVLLLRREDLELVAPVDGAVRGEVARVRLSGPRTVVAVGLGDAPDGSSPGGGSSPAGTEHCEVEVPPGASVTVGEHVGVRLRGGAGTWAVAPGD